MSSVSAVVSGDAVEALRLRREALLAAAAGRGDGSAGVPPLGAAERRLLAGPARPEREAVVDARSVAWCLCQPELAEADHLRSVALQVETRLERLRHRSQGQAPEDAVLLAALRDLRAAFDRAGVSAVDVPAMRAEMAAAMRAGSAEAAVSEPAEAVEIDDLTPPMAPPERAAGRVAGVLVAVVILGGLLAWGLTPLKVPQVTPPPVAATLSSELELESMHTVGTMIYATSAAWPRLAPEVAAAAAEAASARAVAGGFGGLVLFDRAGQTVFTTGAPARSAVAREAG